MIAAFGEADAAQRYALCEVKKMALVPKGDPFNVAIGDVEYQQQHVRKKPLSIVKAGVSKGGHAAGAEDASIKASKKKGDLGCEPLGQRRTGNEAVVGQRLRNKHGTEPDLLATGMWVSRAPAPRCRRASALTKKVDAAGFTAAAWYRWRQGPSSDA